MRQKKQKQKQVNLTHTQGWGKETEPEFERTYILDLPAKGFKAVIINLFKD